MRQDVWTEATTNFAASASPDDGRSSPGKPAKTVDEIQFVLPKGAQLLVDDLLLYEPGP